MILEPITPELVSSPDVRESELLREICSSTLAMYSNTHPELPWVGYLAREHDAIVGTCAFKSPPVEGEAEIAYFTLPGREGQGVATRMAQKLIDLAAGTDAIAVRAQTLPEKNASTRILEKLGFAFCGAVVHPEDGKVWEWRKQIQKAGSRLPSS